MNINKLQINSNESFGAQKLWEKWEIKGRAQTDQKIVSRSRVLYNLK